jgi:hypothetical protein
MPATGAYQCWSEQAAYYVWCVVCHAPIHPDAGTVDADIALNGAKVSLGERSDVNVKRCSFVLEPLVYNSRFLAPRTIIYLVKPCKACNTAHGWFIS